MIPLAACPVPPSPTVPGALAVVEEDTVPEEVCAAPIPELAVGLLPVPFSPGPSVGDAAVLDKIFPDPPSPTDPGADAVFVELVSPDPPSPTVCPAELLAKVLFPLTPPLMAFGTLNTFEVPPADVASSPPPHP